MTDNAPLAANEPGRLARPAAVTGWQRWLPGLRMLRHYQPAWLISDLSAGLVLTSMLVPVGIAYAVASGVPAIYGLYATESRVLDAIASSPTAVKRIVVSAEPVTSVDVTSADVLTDLHHTLRAAQIELHFAEMKNPVKGKLKHLELLEVLGSDIVHPTLGPAVDAYLEQYGVDWKD